MRVSVIIPAAGLGTRMGHGTNRKQLMLLGETPVLIHTVRKFTASPLVVEVLVAVRPDDRPAVDEQLRLAGFDKPVYVVEGGDSRQESVQHALDAVSRDNTVDGSTSKPSGTTTPPPTRQRSPGAARRNGTASPPR